MKKLLIVTTRFPWPLTNGFANKNYWLIRRLSDEYSISLCVIQRSRPSDHDMAKVLNFCDEIKVFRPSYFDIIFGLLESIIKDAPLQLALYKSSKARKYVNEALLRSDAALGSVIRSVQYLIDYDGPIVFDLADSLGQVYSRDSSKLSGIKRLAYHEEGRRLIKYERDAVLFSGMSLFFNKSEASCYDRKFVSVVPHGVDDRLFSVESIDEQYSDGVVIFGRMSFEPNIHAVEWFVDNVLPILPGNVRLYAVGADPSPRLIRLAARVPRLTVTGFMNDPYPALRGAIASVCPIQLGGGIQNKVIESLAVGAHVLVSPLAAQPMPDIQNSGIVVCTTPDEWVNAIVDAVNNRNLSASARVSGRNYARNHFSWCAYAAAVKLGIAEAMRKKIHEGR